jgi:hypothetical protein
MEHLAFLSKKGKFLDKILSGEKTIESRWYKFKRAPFGNISKGEIIYFKESGEPVSAKAEVEKVITYTELNKEKIKEIIKKYGEGICINSSYLDELKTKNYCILIFLKNVKKTKPFEIDKTGYGNMTAWITVDKIKKLKKIIRKITKEEAILVNKAVKVEMQEIRSNKVKLYSFKEVKEKAGFLEKTS